MGARATQLRLTFQEQEVEWLPKEAQSALVAALAELLLGAVEHEPGRRADDESQDHR